MRDEASFLAALEANPNDDDLRLEYAEWLENRRDPRGEFLRLGVEIRQQQARMADLEAQMDPAWLARISGGYRVVLAALADPAKKIALIKEIRDLLGLGLAEAKNFVETPPRVVKEHTTGVEALALKRRLEDAGARITLQPSPGGTSAPTAQAGSDATHCRVVLTAYPPQYKIQVIKLVRDLTGMGLAEAKDFVEHLPGVVWSVAARDRAQEIARRFDGIATVRVEALS